MQFTIQKAVPGDEAILAHIQTQSWIHAFHSILDEETLKEYTGLAKATEMYRQILARGYGTGYILRIEGMPHCIAWWAASRSDDMPGYAELICIHSLPEHWHQGYGRKMMETVLQDMTESGYRKVMLWVFASNTRARCFYEACGFHTEGRENPGITPTEICYERTLP